MHYAPTGTRTVSTNERPIKGGNTICKEDIKLLSAREAAAILGVNANAVYRLRNAGLLDYWNLHGTKKTNMMAIAEFLEKTKNVDLESA